MSAETFEHSAEGSVKADVSPYEAGADVRESFPISLVRGRYLLFDVNGAGYIVDDAAAHQNGLKSMMEQEKQSYLAEREAELRGYAKEHQKAADERKAKFFETRNSKVGSMKSSRVGSPTPGSSTTLPEGVILEEEGEEGNTGDPEVDKTPIAAVSEETSIFQTPQTSQQKDSEHDQLTFHVTTATSPSSYHKLPSLQVTPPHLIPKPPANCYSVYRYMNEKGYFLSPALRFGAKYLAYPGDPLRFHSHFVVNGLDWDEEIDVLDIVGGGRLGTGVKKGWMAGGRNPEKAGEDDDGVRVFSIEWGGF